MNPHPHQSDMLRLEQHYSALLKQHGDSPQAVQYRDRATQERRFQILAEAGLSPDWKVLDFGCGTGHLLEYLRKQHGFKGEYVGYDVSADLLAAAASKFPDARFERRDIFASGVPEEFDAAFVSGVFNNATEHNEAFMTDTLQILFARTRRVLAFNALSNYVDFFDSSLYYTNPDRVFRWCKENLSPLVSLRHDYFVKQGTPPYEFTVYVYQTDIKPRKELKS